MRLALAAACLLASSAIGAAVPTPERPVTDPKSLSSPANPAARPVPLDDLAFGRSALSSTWSRDGRHIFLSTNLTGRFNIWRVDAGGSWPVQLTQSDERQIGLAASRDGKNLWYLQDQGGDELYDIYAVPTAGGAVVNVTNTPEVQEDSLLPSRGGGQVALSTKPKTASQVNLAVLDVATGKVRALTNEADRQMIWSPVAWVDGDAAIIANRENVGYTMSEVWRIEVADGRATRLIGKADTIYQANDATADGRTIQVTSNERTGQKHVGLYDVAAKTWRWLKPTPWEQIGDGFSPDGKRSGHTTSIDGRTSISLVDSATLAETPVALPPGLNFLPAGDSFSPDGARLLAAHSGADTPSELHIVELASGQATQLTRLALGSLDPANLPKSEIVTWKSYDGTLVSGVLTMPFNLTRDGTNPAILIPHGGPTGQTEDGFSRNAAAFASRGYVVLQPNPRGSTGYGKAFQDANRNDLGGGDLKDELAGREFLIASGYVDRKKVGITGGSYGGFMTLMAIGKAPDAFAAAVQLFGIINWRTMWDTSDPLLQQYLASLLGDPAKNGKAYDASSPLTFIGQAKAPLLSLQGERDIRVPASQAREVADVLKGKGVPTETIFYPAEGHGFYKRENQIDALKRTVAWFDKYLKGAGEAAAAKR